MKFLVLIGFFAVSARSFAGIPPDITTFLRAFPDKMTCAGVEVNYLVRTPLTQKMTIEFKNKHSDAPMIEVTAPGSSRSQFRIGDGYGGSMEKVGRYSYEFLDGQNVKALLYVRRIVGDESEFDMQMYMRLRDAGRMISLTKDRVCRTTYNCFEFNNCSAIP
jgi:hypothetical protein